MSLAQPLFRPLAESLFTQSRSGGGGAAAAGSTWDAATKSALLTLSNANLTATATNDGVNYASSTPARSTGKRALKFTLAYSATADDEETVSGLAPEGASLGAGFGDAGGFGFSGDGLLNQQSGNTSLGLLVATGEWFAFLINETTGKGWIKTASGVTGDPEAGTGEVFTFTPGAALVAACVLYSVNNSSPASVTLDPTYSSGTFAAWDS